MIVNAAFLLDRTSDAPKKVLVTDDFSITLVNSCAFFVHRTVPASADVVLYTADIPDEDVTSICMYVKCSNTIPVKFYSYKYKHVEWFTNRWLYMSNSYFDYEKSPNNQSLGSWVAYLSELQEHDYFYKKCIRNDFPQFSQYWETFLLSYNCNLFSFQRHRILAKTLMQNLAEGISSIGHTAQGLIHEI